MQFIFAGKAHPADDAGKAMISEIVRFAKENRRPAPLRLPRRLRHRRGAHALPGRRRVAEHPQRPRRPAARAG
ncbi:MAG: hypothetical protein R2711_19310 [Acidimicrobiales bacterium]